MASLVDIPQCIDLAVRNMAAILSVNHRERLHTIFFNLLAKKVKIVFLILVS